MSQSQYQMSNGAAPDELAAIHQLGKRIDSFPQQKGLAIVVIIALSFILIAEVIIGLPFGFLFVITPLLPHSSSARDSAELAVPLFGVLLIAGFLWVTWLCVKRIINSCRGLGSTVHLYTEGLILTKGNKADVLHWNQVSDVRESVYRGRRFRTTHTYTIRLVDGKKYIFNDLFKDVEFLGYYLMLKNPTGGSETK